MTSGTKSLRHKEKMASKTQVEGFGFNRKRDTSVVMRGKTNTTPYFCRCHYGEMREFLSDYFYFSIRQELRPSAESR